MAGGTEAERLDALERHAVVVSDGLVQAVDHIRALTILLATVLAACSDEDRARIRAVALASLGDGQQDQRVRALLETMTLDPAAQAAGVGALLSGVPGRLQ